MIPILLANSFILLALGISVSNILAAHLYLASSYALGSLIRQTLFPNVISGRLTIISEAVIGSISYSFIMMLLFHFTINSQLLQIFWAIVLPSPIIIIIFKKQIKLTSFKSALARSCKKHHIIHSIVALMLTVLTVYGFSLSPKAVTNTAGISDTITKNWGYQGDKRVHLVKIPSTLATIGMPEKILGHRALQLTVFPAVYITSKYSQRTYIDTFKSISFFIWFALLTSMYYMGRDIFSLTGIYRYVLSVGTVFTGAVQLPLLSLHQSTYAGFLKPLLGTFHNLTILSSILVANIGLYYIYLSIKTKQQNIPLGCIFIAASFFFKPSFFTVLVPPLTIFLFLYLIKKRQPSIALGLLILIMVPIFWQIYSKLFGWDSPPLDPLFKPFHLYFKWASWRYPESITGNHFLFAAAITLSSYLFLFLVSPVAIQIRHFEPQILMITGIITSTFLIGSSIAFTLVEDNYRKYHGNFTWGGHCAYFMIMPLAIYYFQNIKNRFYHSLCCLALSLHWYAGAVHLYLFVAQNRIT